MGHRAEVDEAALDAAALEARTFEPIGRTLEGWAAPEGAAVQFACSVDGSLVYRVAAGTVHSGGPPLDHDHVFPVMSASKAVAAVVMLHLRERGLLAMTDRIARWWPRFARNGKAGATVEHVLSHRLGLPELTAPYRRWGDREYMRTIIEDAAPQWEPGTRYGYHGGSFGPVLDELVWRCTGMSMGQVLEHELCQPLAVADCYMGLPSAASPSLVPLRFLEPEQLAAHRDGPRPPPFGAEHFNDARWLKASNPSSGVVASATGLVRLFELVAQDGTLRGRRYWTEAGQRDAERARNGPAELPASRTLDGARFGLGFLVAPTPRVFGTQPLSSRTVGHIGATGAVVCADATTRTAYAFAINGVGGARALVRCTTVGDLLRDALGQRAPS
jgi:CubicO group peptidase (beta-lactamase class C family)